jgi:acyl-CoA synthetase (AMP-forming)/AMP-acid ligase II
MAIARLADVVRQQAAERPAAIALTFEGRDTTYAELDRRASRVANGLIAAEVRPQSRIALFDKNHDSFYEIWFGAAKANAVLVPVNWRLAPPEIAFVINDCGAEMLFVGAELCDTVAAIRDRLPNVREVIITDRDYPRWRDRRSAATGG